MSRYRVAFSEQITNVYIVFYAYSIFLSWFLLAVTVITYYEMLELIQKYGLTALVLLLVVATSHSFHSLGLNFGYNILYVLLLSLFGFSYYRACVIEPGYIYYTDEESRVHEWERKSDGSRRFCRKCRIYKPGEVLLSKCSNLTACRPLTPLLIVQQMCVQDGPSLSLVSVS